MQIVAYVSAISRISFRRSIGVFSELVYTSPTRMVAMTVCNGSSGLLDSDSQPIRTTWIWPLCTRESAAKNQPDLCERTGAGETSRRPQNVHYRQLRYLTRWLVIILLAFCHLGPKRMSLKFPKEFNSGWCISTRRS